MDGDGVKAFIDIQMEISSRVNGVMMKSSMGAIVFKKGDGSKAVSRKDR
jgi:hypothetical protein